MSKKAAKLLQDQLLRLPMALDRDNDSTHSAAADWQQSR
jgi:hypothetical protein